MNWSEIHIWPLLAGLGLFLFGMFMLEESLKALAGRSFKLFLRRHTTNPVKAVLSGALVTAILQSSSMVSLLVMSFAGAGIIGLKNGIGMILGANLGTTATSWLMSLLGFKLNLGEFILPFLAVGGLGIMFMKSEQPRNFAKALMGFSFMFMGINYMKEGFEEFALHLEFGFLADKPGILFLFVGMFLAAAIHSSTGSMMIFMSSLAAGVITLDQAMFLAIGADMGTTVTAVTGTIRANAIRQKVGWSQFFFNLFTAILALIMMKVYLYLIQEVAGIADPLITLAAFHTTINLAGVIIIMPFLSQFTAFINKVIKGDEERLADKIKQVNPAESHAAIEALNDEAGEFFKKALAVLHGFFNLSHQLLPHGKVEDYNALKNYEDEIATFYIKLQQSSLDETEVSRVNNLISAIRNSTLASKNMKDIKHNLDEISGSPQDDMFEFYQTIRDHQKKFYDEITALVTRQTYCSPEDVVRLKDMLKSYYQHESENVYKHFAARKHREIVVPNLLNMIREITDSNEALLRSLNYLVLAGGKIRQSLTAE
jgi:phosphate:Na+ symporter